MAGLTGWHLVIPLVVVTALVDPGRPSDAARGLGRSTRIRRAELPGFAEPHRVAGAPGEGPAATGIGARSRPVGASSNGDRQCST